MILWPNGSANQTAAAPKLFLSICFDRRNLLSLIRCHDHFEIVFFEDLEMRSLKFLVLAAVLALPVSFPNPGILSSFLSYDGQSDQLIDESIGRVIDVNQSGSIDAGDVITGFLSVRETSATGNLAANQQLNAVLSFTVGTSANFGRGVGGGVFQTVTATAAASVFSLQNLLGDGSIDSTAIAAIYTSNNQTGDFVQDDFNTALNFVTAGFLDGYLALNAMAGDFLQIQTSFGIDANGDGEIQFSELPAASDSGTNFAEEVGGFSYIAAGTDLGSLLPVDVTATPVGGGATTQHDFGLTGQLRGPTTNTDGDFQNTNATVISVNPVPEPASIAIWMFGVVGLGIGSASKFEVDLLGKCFSTDK